MNERKVKYQKAGGVAAGGPAYKKAYAFALHIIKICEQVREDKKEFVLSKQLLRSATSVGANLAEAGAAISGLDLSSKASIAYKECQESKYWISLMADADYLDHAIADELISEADEIARILFSTIRTLRINNQ